MTVAESGGTPLLELDDELDELDDELELEEEELSDDELDDDELLDESLDELDEPLVSGSSPELPPPQPAINPAINNVSNFPCQPTDTLSGCCNDRLHAEAEEHPAFSW